MIPGHQPAGSIRRGGQRCSAITTTSRTTPNSTRARPECGKDAVTDRAVALGARTLECGLRRLKPSDDLVVVVARRIAPGRHLVEQEQRFVMFGAEALKPVPLLLQVSGELVARPRARADLLRQLVRLHDQLLDPARRVRLLEAQMVDLALQTSLLRTRIDKLAPEPLAGIRAGPGLRWRRRRRGRCRGFNGDRRRRFARRRRGGGRRPRTRRAPRLQRDREVGGDAQLGRVQFRAGRRARERCVP
jgi:hypothetical protein